MAKSRKYVAAKRVVKAPATTPGLLPPVAAPNVVSISSTDGIVPLEVNGKNYDLDATSVGLEIDQLLPKCEEGEEPTPAELDQFFGGIAKIMSRLFGGAEFSNGAAQKFYVAITNANSELKKSMPQMQR